MLSAVELTALRKDLTASLPGTAVVTRSTTTSDGFGGQTEAWAAIGTVAARVSPTSLGDENIAGGGLVHVGPWSVQLPYGTDITERDRVTYDGMTLEVLGISEPRSWSLGVRCDCREAN